MAEKCSKMGKHTAIQQICLQYPVPAASGSEKEHSKTHQCGPPALVSTEQNSPKANISPHTCAHVAYSKGSGRPPQLTQIESVGAWQN